MKLRYVLTIVFIVLAAIPLFSGLHFLNQRSGEYYRTQVENHLSALSQIAKKRVLATFERIQDNTALVASRTQMRVSLDHWNKTRETASRDKITRIINDANHGLALLKEIRVYDPDGNLVASTSGTTENLRIDVSTIDRTRVTLEKEGNLVQAIGVAPLILEHKTAGFLRLSFFTDFLTDLVRDRSGLGNTGEWLVAVRGENGDAVFAVPLKYDHTAALNRRVSKERLDVPITQALLGNEVVMSNAPDYLENPVMASTRYIDELDWGLVAKIDEEEVAQLLNKNNKFIYLTEFIIVILSITAGVLLSAFISGPIEKLKAYTTNVANGSFEPPPNVGGWEEVKQLTTHFEYMVDSLRELNESLNDKVEERTKELHDANKKLELLATQDPLTGLHNRRYFDENFDLEFRRAIRYGHRLAIVSFDIDHFKSVNDTYGHDIGDLVLIHIAEYLKRAVRDTDVLARVGGEEFGLVLPEIQEHSCLAFVERLRTDISAIEVHTKDGPINVTCSFGVAFYNDEVGDWQALLKQADLALYEAKETGRNCVVRYSAGL